MLTIRHLFILLTVLYCTGAASAGLLTCLRDKCFRSVAGVVELVELFEHKKDCQSFLAVTVTPAASTVTVTKHHTVDATVTKTSVETTVTESETVATVVETLTTSTATITDLPVKRDFQRHPVTFRHTHIPPYGDCCSGPQQFSSACSCLGIHGTTTTVRAPTTTITVSVTSTHTSTKTVEATDYTTIDLTATSTLDVAATTTVAGSCPSPSVICIFASNPCTNLRTDPNNCGACGNACASGSSCVNGLCSQQCTIAPCGVDNPCDTGNTNCFCKVSSTGPTFCVDLSAQSTAPYCTTDEQCPQGEICATDTCLGSLCLPANTCINTGAPARLFRRNRRSLNMPRE